MKTIKFYVIIATLAFITTSCVENSVKYKAAIAQRDSIAMQKQALDSNYNQTLALLNDIENGFATISQNESQMRVNLKGVESKTSDKKALIGAQMKAIKESMDQNKAKIAELRHLEAKKNKANIILQETIKRLQTVLDAQDVQIQSLQAELDQKNIKIAALNTTVDNQSKNISEQQSTIMGQDKDMNTVWYCVATSKKLQQAKIISASGLFKASKVMNTEFDKSVFTQVDLRNLSTIPTNSKNVKILTSHPQSSYNLVKDADKNIIIEITKPSKFWSVSKYLVVQI